MIDETNWVHHQLSGGAGAGTPPGIDRYKNDMKQAMEMQKVLKKNQERKGALTEEDIQSGLNGLQQAEKLTRDILAREESSIGRTTNDDEETALRIYKLSLEMLIKFLQSDPSVLPNVDRENVNVHVRAALTDAETLKLRIKQREEQVKQAKSQAKVPTPASAAAASQTLTKPGKTASKPSASSASTMVTRSKTAANKNLKSSSFGGVDSSSTTANNAGRGKKTKSFFSAVNNALGIQSSASSESESSRKQHSSSSSQRQASKTPPRVRQTTGQSTSSVNTGAGTSTSTSTANSRQPSQRRPATQRQESSRRRVTSQPANPPPAASAVVKRNTIKPPNNVPAAPVASGTKAATSPSKFLNSNDPLVQTVKSDLYVDPSHLQNMTWDDIAGLADAKQSLQEAAILPLMRPDLFTGLRKPRNILLYGPPGTGKTMLVRAVAKESQCLLFLCTASALTSKWHGESEKLVRTLFEVARAAAPSIIFVDEMDALLSTRKSDGEHEASRRFKTEFMTQVDGIVKSGGSEKNVLVIACTNCPWDIDSAVLRRFPRRIYIPLPDTDTRKVLVKKLLEKAGNHSLSRSEIKEVVKRTHGFSGSDLTSIASEAAFGPLRDLGGMLAIRDVQVNDIRPIGLNDFEMAISQATKSVSKDLLKQYDDWKKEQAAS